MRLSIVPLSRHYFQRGSTISTIGTFRMLMVCNAEEALWVIEREVDALMTR